MSYADKMDEALLAGGDIKISMWVAWRTFEVAKEADAEIKTLRAFVKEMADVHRVSIPFYQKMKDKAIKILGEDK